MKLSRILYFGDFVAIPVAIAAMVASAFVKFGESAALPIVLSLGLGAVGWTLVEYLIHRVVYHHTPFFAKFHGEHHASPKAFLGFPSFASSGLIVAAVFLPLYDRSFVIACGLTSGMLLGYGYYMFVHHAAHHFAIRPGDFLYGAWVRHMAHHYHDNGNFGVTTGAWDIVFASRVRRVSL